MRVDPHGPAVTAFSAAPTYINPTVMNATTLAATIQDDLTGGQAFYYGPLSMGVLFVQASVDDTHPVTPSLAVVGIRDVTFPSLFQPSNGSVRQGDGSPAGGMSIVV
ncbi:MAG: hypothetical protein ACOYYS_17905 [Chloroflexota bacterium]